MELGQRYPSVFNLTSLLTQFSILQSYQLFCLEQDLLLELQLRRLLQHQHSGNLHHQPLDLEPLQELLQHLDWDNLQLLQWLQHLVLLQQQPAVLVLVRVLQPLRLELLSSQLPPCHYPLANIHFSSITIFIRCINSSSTFIWTNMSTQPPFGQASAQPGFGQAAA